MGALRQMFGSIFLYFFNIQIWQTETLVGSGNNQILLIKRIWKWKEKEKEEEGEEEVKE